MDAGCWGQNKGATCTQVVGVETRARHGRRLLRSKQGRDMDAGCWGQNKGRNRGHVPSVGASTGDMNIP
eukprot:364990-Chlamydomonas_euryale.AAC.1